MAQEPISHFFARLGFKLKNDRTSWGATNGNAVLLRTWAHDLLQAPRRVRVFLNDQQQNGTLTGTNERKAHVRALWVGGCPGYAVVATRLAGRPGARETGEFRTDIVYPIERLVEEGVSIYAVLANPVLVAALGAHMQAHRVVANAAPAPQVLEDLTSQQPDEAHAQYLARMMREYLIDLAKRQKTATYSEVFDEFSLNRFSVIPVLDKVGKQCVAAGEPVLTALVVYATGASTGRCGPGFKEAFQVDEDDERQRIFEHWSEAQKAERLHKQDWADEELEASVLVYLEMMRLKLAGETFVKARYYQQLSERFGRPPGAFERRMQNISHLLSERELEWLQGLVPQANIGENVAPRLLMILDRHLPAILMETPLPDEVNDPAAVIEGAKKQVVVNAYERDPTAKPRCVKKWGTKCVVCDFDFHAAYGELGKGFIHVHHLRPLHTIGESYELDPETDLRPVCPNCHSMLHRKKEVLSIEELIGRLRWRFIVPSA